MIDVHVTKFFLSIEISSENFNALTKQPHFA
uniref:Uncharacterized protein n=1 Tax=Rhizophora mucronata TaxID=61149 RepID=A0A2P2R241_RHIMU